MIYQDVNVYLFPNCSLLFPSRSHILKGRRPAKGKETKKTVSVGIQIPDLFSAMDKNVGEKGKIAVYCF